MVVKDTVTVVLQNGEEMNKKIKFTCSKNSLECSKCRLSLWCHCSHLPWSNALNGGNCKFIIHWCTKSSQTKWALYYYIYSRIKMHQQRIGFKKLQEKEDK